MCRFCSAMRRVFFGFQQEPIQLGTGRGRRWHRSYKAPGTKMLPAPPAPFLPLCWVLGGCRGDAAPQNLQLGGSWCPACWVGRGCACLAVLHRNHTGLVGKEGTSGTPGAIATGRWSWEEGGINKIKASAASRAVVKGEAVAGLKLPGGFLVSDIKCNPPLQPSACPCGILSSLPSHSRGRPPAPALPPSSLAQDPNFGVPGLAASSGGEKSYPWELQQGSSIGALKRSRGHGTELCCSQGKRLFY